ncbi:MAG: DUF1629 domain-containing protein [Bacteroidota bacterium]
MAVDNKYYFFSPKHKSDVTSAYAPEGTKLDHELIPEIEKLDEMPFEFNLVRLKATKDGLIPNNDLSGLNKIWLDLQPNSFAWPLMSLKLQAVVENNLTKKEGVKWLKAKINGNGEKRDYFIPRFINKLDVLDEEKTTFVPGTDHIIKPSFNLSKIQEYVIFHQPSPFWQITSSIYISESLKKAIQKEKLTGVSFEKASVV